MYHCIIVKFNDQMKDLTASMPRIRELFDASLSIPGITGVDYFHNCTPRPNRYDLMIEMTMEEEALEAYNVSEMHQTWKREYGPLLEAKTIFDCE